MELKFQRIALDDHYLSLYGPLNKQKSVESINQIRDDSKGEADVKPSKTPESSQQMAGHLSIKKQRSILQQAFSSNPYERYRVTLPNSMEGDEISKEILNQRRRSRKFNFASNQLNKSVLPIAMGIALDPTTVVEVPSELNLNSVIVLDK